MFDILVKEFSLDVRFPFHCSSGVIKYADWHGVNIMSKYGQSVYICTAIGLASECPSIEEGRDRIGRMLADIKKNEVRDKIRYMEKDFV